MSGWIKFFSALILLPVALLYLIALPFVYLYGLGLLVLSWYFLNNNDLKVLIVHNCEKDPCGVLDHLKRARFLEGRTIFLDFADEGNWPRRSLPVKLFWHFGPISKPPEFTDRNLPAVLVLNKFRRPKIFSFGESSKDRDSKFEELLVELKES